MKSEIVKVFNIFHFLVTIIIILTGYDIRMLTVLVIYLYTLALLV